MLVYLLTADFPFGTFLYRTKQLPRTMDNTAVFSEVGSLSRTHWKQYLFALKIAVKIADVCSAENLNGSGTPMLQMKS